jgi:hypothetical protein
VSDFKNPASFYHMTDFEVIFCQNLESAALGASKGVGPPTASLMKKSCDTQFGVISGLKMIDFDVTRNLIMFDPYSHYVVRPVTVNRPGEK